MINVVDLSKSWKIKIVMWKKSRQNDWSLLLLECKQFSPNFVTIFPFFAFKEKLS